MNEEIALLIKKYLRGECSPDEERRLLAWYETFENEPDPLALLPETEKDELRGKMFRKVMHNLEEIPAGPVVTGKRPVRSLVYLASGIAAALALWFVFSPLEEQIKPGSGQVSETASQLRSVTNNERTIRRELLPDGSIVWLQPGATLRFSGLLEGHERRVNFEGDAFFDIAKNKERPFVIQSERLITTVLGTSFRIRSVKTDPVASVSVMTGRVNVQLAAPAGATGTGVARLLTANETVQFVNGTAAVSGAAAPEMAMWKKNSVSFDKTPVNEVVDALNRLFRVHITKPSPTLGNYRLTADFSEQNLADVLEMMKVALHIDYEIRGTEIRLTSRKDVPAANTNP